MIFVTGDIHSRPKERLSPNCFPEGKEMTKDDYVIICGDFGVVWDQEKEGKIEKELLDWLEAFPFSVLFCDGNHENFDRLKEYPEKEWHGGKVYEIRPHVLHLMRGYVFDIEDKKFFVFGGASSHDVSDGILDPLKDKAKIEKWKKEPSKMFRVSHVSWWKEELPTREEMRRGLESLEKVDYKVDFVITHSPTTSTLVLLGAGRFKNDYLSDYLEEIKVKLDYKYWFCGHMHVDKQLNTQDIILFEQIIRIA